MASFPTTIYSTTNPNPSDNLSTGHAGQHDGANNEVIAIETKVGINGSADTTSIDYKVNNIATAQIATGAVTTAKIANNAVTATQIANATITTTQISGSAGITGGQIASATVAGSNIGTGTVSGGNIVSSPSFGGNPEAGSNRLIQALDASSLYMQVGHIGTAKYSC